MLRILWHQEPNLRNAPVILVCQTSIERIECPQEHQLINLNLKDYCKAKMCNVGVEVCQTPMFALLDSDRMLPFNYFYNKIDLLQEKQAITTLWLYKLSKLHTDDDLIKNKLNLLKKEQRSPDNIMGQKNLFCGNTLMFKKDYHNMGGMDEKYIGYGLSDNDTTYLAKIKGIKGVFNDEIEIHFHHSRKVCYENQMFSPNQWEIAMALNGKKFLNKWGDANPQWTRWINTLIKRVENKLNTFDPILRERFINYV
jgi:hypothetical protein